MIKIEEIKAVIQHLNETVQVLFLPGIVYIAVAALVIDEV